MKQTTFCFCPNCRNELCGTGSFVSDIDGLVTYKCTGCGKESKWNFDAPVPVLLY